MLVKIALLGGSFDPPHIGHYLVLRQILDFRPDIDKILLVPAYQHQWKPSFVKVHDRLNMTKFLLQEKTEISEIEIQRKGISYTIDTVREIKKQTQGEIYWIVGSDIVAEFHKWEKTNELLSITKFLVFPRDPYHLPEKLPFGFELIQHENLITTNISSTAVRKRIKDGKSITCLVPAKVEKYIRENELYL